MVRIIVTEEGQQYLRDGTDLFRRYLAERFSILDEEELLLFSESLENVRTILARIG